MNRFLIILLAFLVLGYGTSCAGDEPVKDMDAGSSAYFGGKKVLVAYFSWGGTTKRMAEQIQEMTGADVFRIEPQNPYPTASRHARKLRLPRKTTMPVPR